jgi:oligopeptide transport system substrate-binding protein
MISKKALFALVAIVMVATLVLSGCAKTGASGPVVNINWGTEPPSLDPSLATDNVSINAAENLFLGLTNFDEVTVEVQPELATEWSVSGDGLVWTFKMRKDVEWVHYDPATKKTTKKGKVTANDVVYGVKRTIDPATASDYAYVCYIIKNAQAVNTGESTDIDSVGVRAVDDYTVEFTLEQPAGYFPAIAGMWVNRAMPKAAIDEHGEKWTEAGNIWSNGPYMLEAWEHESFMDMVKNPHYYDAKNVQIAKVHGVMVVEESTAFAMYENGELDTVGPPLDDMDRIKADPQLKTELYIGPDLSTYYYGFNTTKAPFDNAKVRLAFSLAIDRQKLIDTVTKGEQLPAKSFAPDGIFGSVATDSSFVGVAYDPARAKQVLADAGYADGKGLPEITLMFNTSEGHQKIAQFIQQNWKEVLGVEVKLANQEWKVYLNTLSEDSPQVYRLGWGADYPDQNNWVLEVFHPTKSDNRPLWDPEDPLAKQFMSVTEQAAASPDPAARKKLYFEAEKILCEDAAVMAPIYYYSTVNMSKPYLKRTYAKAGGEQFNHWTIEKK